MVTMGALLWTIDPDESIDVRVRSGDQVYRGSVRELKELSGISSQETDVLDIRTMPDADVGRVLTIMLNRR